MIELDPKSTALVLIDLQNGILGQSLGPSSGGEVLDVGKVLAGRFRAVRAPVVLVNVGWSTDYADALHQPVDRPVQRPEGGFPPAWSALAEGLAQPGDLFLTKHHWGAFHGTDLDIILRSHGIRTVVLTGVSTHVCVETAAREAFVRDYYTVVVGDGSAAYSQQEHETALKLVDRFFGEVVSMDDIRPLWPLRNL